MSEKILQGIKNKYREHLDKELRKNPVAGEGAKVVQRILNGEKAPADFHFLNKLEKLVLSEIGNKKEYLQERLESVEPQSILFPQNGIEVSKQSEEFYRDSKKVKIASMAENPIKEPFEEVLFTSNVLLTLPEDKGWTSPLSSRIDWDEPQAYWFDHPVALDAKREENEIIYGLTQFNNSVKEENPQAKATILLSITCTHKKLSPVAREAVRNMLANENFSHLTVYAFSENDCNELLSRYFTLSTEEKALVSEVFGTDGLYGRHYSFLKGILSFWHRFVDPKKRATFKIDLDQTFDQEKLKRDTGGFAFEKFTDPRWGARAVDVAGKEVYMGLLAGSLVNIGDIEKSVFTCDTPKPSEQFEGENFAMYTDRVRYLSTLSEMGTRYQNQDDCSMRYHVTGGTSGILLEALEKYRPFTPTFIGRAEDQGYILSALDKEVEGAFLRCLHADGLVMRHDKGAFAAKAVKAGKIPSVVGNYERLLIWEHLTKEVLSIFKLVKSEMTPFTGCYVQEAPLTLIYFQLLLFIVKMEKESPEQVPFLLENAEIRLTELINNLTSGFYKTQYERESKGWNIYYDFLAAVNPSDSEKEKIKAYLVK